MSTIKTFFEKNNLNRGYGKHTKDNKVIGGEEDSNASPRRLHNELLSIDMIERYEELSPGSFEKIVGMSALEQKHRHAIEEQQQKALELDAKLGRFFSILVICIISATTLALALCGAHLVAGVFAGFAFSGMYLMSRMLHTKPPRFDQNSLAKKRVNKYPDRRRGGGAPS